MKQVTIHTDGGCAPTNPGEGGWAAILSYEGHDKEINGYVPMSTNERMELTAAIMAFRALKEPVAVQFFSDSQYVTEGMRLWVHRWKVNGWRNSKKKPVENQDLWLELVAASEKHAVSWNWVRGHSGHIKNERVDNLVWEVRRLKGAK